MFGFLSHCSRRVARYKQQRASARALAALDDRQIKDIGLNRSQIPAAVGQNLCADPFQSY